MPLRARIDSEAGFSLPEILVTIVIVGITFTAVLGGMITSITVSGMHRKQATADTLARDAAESVKDFKVAYVPCAGTNAYTSALPPAPSGYTTSITAVEYWNGAAAPPPGPAPPPYPVTFGSSCPSPDSGAQRITISVSYGSGTEWVQVVKRNTS